MKRTAFRISRNNCFAVFTPYTSLFEKVEATEQDKLVFFFLFSGVKGGTLDKKLDKFTSNFSNQNYKIPENATELNKQKAILEEELAEN